MGLAVIFDQPLSNYTFFALYLELANGASLVHLATCKRSLRDRPNIGEAADMFPNLVSGRAHLDGNRSA